MKHLYSILAGILFLSVISSRAQTTLFSSISGANQVLVASSACGTPKTAALSGWSFTTSSAGNCGITWGGGVGSEGDVRFINSGGNWIYGYFAQTSGTAFKLLNLSCGSASSLWSNSSAIFVGYRNGSPVPGATLTSSPYTGGSLNASGGGATSGTINVSFTGSTAFDNVDQIYVVNSTASPATFALCDITIASAVSCTTPTLTTVGQTSVLCNGGSNGSATVSASGGSPFTYTWSPSGGNAAIATGLGAGSYTCVTTNSCGSTDQQVITINEPASALGGAVNIQTVLCNGGNTGSATITASGGTAPYTYSWSTGSTGSVISTQTVGVKTVTITDVNSCTAIRSNTIVQPSAIGTSTGYTNVFCNGGVGSASILASGGIAPYTYTWSTGTTGSVITGVPAGSYTVKATDANNCSSSTRTIVISQPAALVSSTAVTNALCNGSPGSATVTASGGTGAYSYTWQSGPTTSVVASLSAGTYTVRVTDANNCTNTQSVTITQPSAIVINTAVTNVSCNSGTNGSATITASGGAGAYTYSWSSGATASVISNVIAGAYTATVTDGISCTSIKTITITQPTALNTSTAVTNVACNGGTGSATISTTGGTGAYTYSWSSGATTSVVTGIFPGPYTATVTDANSCTSVKSVSITQPASALVTTTALTNIACNGGTGSATITASGGTGAYTYSWSSGATASVVSGISAGPYTATVTDANNCTSIKSVSITQPASALVTTTALTNVACNGGNGSATITASGGTSAYTYSWSSGATTSVVSGIPAGAYTATVTDANSCTSIKSVTITQPTALNTSTALTNVACNGGTGSATISTTGGTGAYTYSWSSGATTSVVTGIFAGPYTATVTDANNCTSVKSVSITQPFLLSVSAAASPTSICSGATSTLLASVSGGTGAYSYSWTTGATTASAAVSPTTTTLYSINVTDANACQKTQTISLTVFALPTISVNSATICSGASVVITPSGAVTYSITGGNFTVTPSSNSSYTVIGANSCAGNSVVATISVNTTPSLSVNSATICSGASVAITPTGAGTYSITGGSFTVSPTANASYSVTGTGANGCAASNTIVSTVSVNASPTLSVNSASICSGVSVVITPSGAVTYSITGNTYTVTPATTTSYSVTGVSAAGCASSNTIVSTITVNPRPNITVNSATICSGASVVITPTATGVASYTITGGSYTVTPTPGSNTYSVTGTGTNGCVSSGAAVSTIFVNTTPTLTINNATVCAGNSVVIVPTGSNITSYTITGNTYTVSPGVTTSYSVSGTGGNGCVSAAVVSTITVNARPNITVNSASICSGNSVVITPTGAATYTITGGTFTVNPVVDASYTVTGTSTAGCTSTNVVVASVTVNITPTLTAGSASICAGSFVVITPTGAATYTISGGTFTVNPTMNTSYSVTGTSTAGCVSDVAVFNVTVNANPTISVNSATICSGSSLVITPTGVVTYTISAPDFTVNPISNSTYSVMGTDANGCLSAVAISTVTVNELPNLTIMPSSSVFCVGQTFTLTAGGAASYSWSTAQTDATITVVPTTAGTATYIVTGTGANGCANTATLSQLVENCSTGIKTQNAAMLSFGMYPNPNTGEFVIEAKTNVSITIKNSLGQVVYTEKTASDKTSINIGHLASGIYFVTAELNGSQHTAKLVKE